RLTSDADTVLGTSGDDLVSGTSATLNPGDSLAGGDGTDTLTLSGGGSFHLDQLAQFTGFENVQVQGSGSYDLTLGEAGLEVDLSAAQAGGTVGLGSGVSRVKLSGSSNTLNFSTGATTVEGAANGSFFNLSSGDAVFRLDSVFESTYNLSSGSADFTINSLGRSTFNLGTGQFNLVVNNDSGASGIRTVNLSSGSYNIENKSARPYGIRAVADTNDDFHVGDSLTNVQLVLQASSPTTYNLSNLSLNNVAVQLNGATLIGDGLAGVTAVNGSGSSALVYSGTMADLAGIPVSNVAVTSTNATGTTFRVGDAGTALQIQGGAGNDTIDARSVTLTAAQRQQIFTQGSIETIQDASGTY
ncbi:hypothetical protein, partial [Methylobacterium thuringiense]|uniref:hypothetical protein n=1 Tax=Methylobacterium thuringiense TaxID=1003091 RepID=UPI001EDEFB87